MNTASAALLFQPRFQYSSPTSTKASSGNYQQGEKPTRAENSFRTVLLNVGTLSHDRPASESEKHSEIKAFCHLSATGKTNRNRATSESCHLLGNLRYNEKQRPLGGRKKGRLSQHSRKTMLSRETVLRRASCSEGKRLPGISPSAFKNRMRLPINKSRGSCSREIRPASVPPPWRRTSRKRSPRKPSYLLSN